MQGLFYISLPFAADWRCLKRSEEPRNDVFWLLLCRQAWSIRRRGSVIPCKYRSRDSLLRCPIFTKCSNLRHSTKPRYRNGESSVPSPCHSCFCSWRYLQPAAISLISTESTVSAIDCCLSVQQLQWCRVAIHADLTFSGVSPKMKKGAHVICCISNDAWYSCLGAGVLLFLSTKLYF